MMKWKKYDKDNLPPIGEEVLAYSKKWINEDFNPRGIRVGFQCDYGDFISAYWWDYQDDYIAISKDICEGSPEFFENHMDKTEPEYWIEFPKLNLPDNS